MVGTARDPPSLPRPARACGPSCQLGEDRGTCGQGVLPFSASKSAHACLAQLPAVLRTQQEAAFPHGSLVGGFSLIVFLCQSPYAPQRTVTREQAAPTVHHPPLQAPASSVGAPLGCASAQES